ncbi:MAG: hypothetical protein RXS42_06345 [Nitrososphaeria archaeon]
MAEPVLARLFTSTVRSSDPLPGVAFALTERTLFMWTRGRTSQALGAASLATSSASLATSSASSRPTIDPSASAVPS